MATSLGVSRLLTPLLKWPVESQQQARRNAMIASTALAQRRAEREDVEEFFAALGKDTVSAPPVLTPASRAAHG
jgi:hypothetical protein